MVMMNVAASLGGSVAQAD